VTAEEVLGEQALAMTMAGIGNFSGMPARQRRVALVGGGADGTLIPRGYQAALQDTFVARGEYEDGTGVEKATYRKRERRLCVCAARVVDYVFDGLP
jgi:hypothetical protein